jgi:hypothetical protein
MSLKYNLDDVVVLGETVDTHKGFTPGVAVRIGGLCDAGTDVEHYTIYTLGSKGRVWWVGESEINHEATEELQKSNESGYLVQKISAENDVVSYGVSESTPNNTEEMKMEFKVGDKVELVAGCYEPSVPKGSILNVVKDGTLGSYWINQNSVEVSMLNAYLQEFKLMKDTPKAQDNSWYENGELPPVGTVCECQNDLMQWLKGTIVYVGEDYGTTLAIMQTSTEILYGEAGEFRPSYSDDEIAAQERKKVIDAISDVLIETERMSGYTDVAAHLYESGLRFVEEDK